MSTSLVDQLREIVGAQNVLTSQVDLSVYECDAETLDVARPEIVVLPNSTEETALIVKAAVRHGVSFSPRGAGTGLSGGSTAVQGGLMIAMTRMNRVLHVDPIDRRPPFKLVPLICPSRKNQNATTSILRQIHRAKSLLQSAEIWPENAGGPHCLKYGMTTDHVLGATVVLPDGSVTKFGGKARDRNGLDLLGIFVGSEGTLGLATEAILKLSPRPQAVETMLAYFPSVESGGQAVSDIVAVGVVPAAMEMIDHLTINAVEDAYHLGLKRDAGALLIVELDGPRDRNSRP